ncbi:MAG: hypothetical protein MZV65_33385 [Chromatiales bacterium]|nr:hypothetical protein [Chromatiales bacterium]
MLQLKIHDFAPDLESYQQAYRETHNKRLAAVGVLLYILTIVELCGNHRIISWAPTNMKKQTMPILTFAALLLFSFENAIAENETSPPWRTQ